MLFFLKTWTLDELQKPSSTSYDMPSSELLSIVCTLELKQEGLCLSVELSEWHAVRI